MMNKNILIGVIIVVVLGFILFQSNDGNAPADTSPKGTPQSEQSVDITGQVEEFEIEGANHIAAGQTGVEYKTNPPTSGSHWPNAAEWNFYDDELTDEQLVHNLEHGGIWISYKDLSEEEINTLKEIEAENKGAVIITPREANDARIVVASWGRYMKLENIDRESIQNYINEYINNSPEKLIHN